MALLGAFIILGDTVGQEYALCEGVACLDLEGLCCSRELDFYMSLVIGIEIIRIDYTCSISKAHAELKARSRAGQYDQNPAVGDLRTDARVDNDFLAHAQNEIIGGDEIIACRACRGTSGKLYVFITVSAELFL